MRARALLVAAAESRQGCILVPLNIREVAAGGEPTGSDHAEHDLQEPTQAATHVAKREAQARDDDDDHGDDRGRAPNRGGD